MNRRLRNIAYSPLWALLHLLALMPFGILYAVSDLLYFLIYRVVRYRRRLVEENIYASFPEKTDAEKQAIIKKFYRHFTDTFVETIKLLHISDEEMRRHMIFEGVERVDEYTAAGRSVAVYAAHFGNWEWLTSIALWSRNLENVHFSQVYRPLRNAWFDEFYFNLRSRFNTDSIPKWGVLKALLRYRREGCYVTGFISDQKPSHNDGLHHVEFLGQDTPFITGTELVLRKLNPAVMFFKVEKLKRGYYKVILADICEEAAKSKEFEITDEFARLLEKEIRRQPEIWLWSHNRWRRPIK